MIAAAKLMSFEEGIIGDNGDPAGRRASRASKSIRSGALDENRAR